MNSISPKEARKLAKDLNLDLRKIPLKEWTYAINVETEHGSMFDKIADTNVTKDNPKLTAAIALAHLIEYPDYYKRLRKMEASAEKYWSKKRPNILKNK